jgi:hypothetical protein
MYSLKELRFLKLIHDTYQCPEWDMNLVPFKYITV